MNASMTQALSSCLPSSLGAENAVSSVTGTTKQHFHYFTRVQPCTENKSIDCAMCARGMCSTEL